MEPITAKELTERLKQEKTIEACGMTFRIRKAPLLLLADEKEDLWSLARQGHELLSGRIKDLIASPSLPRMSRILVAGVVEPRLSIFQKDDEVLVDLILANYRLSSELFIAIINFSLEPTNPRTEA